MLKIEIIYHQADKSLQRFFVEAPMQSQIGELLAQSGIYETYPETRSLPYGIFGKKVEADYVLKAGDRVEIYRPLTNDPKDKRRKRAQN